MGQHHVQYRLYTYYALYTTPYHHTRNTALERFTTIHCTTTTHLLLHLLHALHVLQGNLDVVLHHAADVVHLLLDLPELAYVW
jgi:hypothetical protein